MKLALNILLALFVSGLMTACKSKKKKGEKNKYFPALGYIKSQVAKVDTSLYSIIRINFIDSIHNDTTYIRRENFKDAAKEFLAIPDLTDAEYTDRFTEDTYFDETLGRVMMTYIPVEIKKEEIQRQEILIKPGPPEDKVTTIIINTINSNKDSSIERIMLWKVDESFTVTTVKQYPGKPENTSTYKVAWNESDQE